MNRAIAATFLCVLAGGAFATPTYEGFRRSATVTYETGTIVSIECAGPDQCDVILEKAGIRSVVSHRAMGGMVVRPYHLALVNDGQDGKFVVEVEVGCQTYAEIPPAFVCIAQFTISDQKVIDTLVLKRTLVDTRDVEPLIVK